MNLRWFTSKTVRNASAMRKHVRKLLDHQRDILSPQAVEAIEKSMAELHAATDKGVSREDLLKAMQSLEDTANKWLKPYPHASVRENVEVLLVALAVAMAIRTFFIQPFKIPTGSMQPTLFGVTSQNLLEDPNAKVTTGWERVKEWFGGVSYLHFVADMDGSFGGASAPLRILIFNIKQDFVFAGRTHTIWFPPDYGSATLEMRAGLDRLRSYRKGEDVFKLKVSAGDHLFVDRLTYNFRAPQRGEIIVFETKGIPEDNRAMCGIPGDQFYIKRLVALGGERVQIGADRHLVIDGKRLDASTPHFNYLYGFDPKTPAQESHYSGHVLSPRLAPYFGGKPEGVEIPRGEYMVMGDNTLNSLDSRAWGPFPSEYVIGKACFVYWPITERFATSYHH